MSQLRRNAQRILRRVHSLGRPLRQFSGPALPPTFLVIGAQKAGTTSLFTFLADHPEIAAPDTKEIDFFGCPRRRGKGLEFYHSHFPRRRRNAGKLTFEASPHYLTSTEAAAHIHSYAPGMRLVVLLRDPVDRAYSAWNFYRGLNRRDPGWYRRWSQRCGEDLSGDRVTSRSANFGDDFEADVRVELAAIEEARPIALPVVSHGFYCDQLSRYLGHFPSSQILVECSEEFRRDPAETLQRIEGFLDLTPYAWSAGQLRPEYTGTYAEEVTEPARRLLASVYAEPNRRLFELVGREYGWT